MGMKVRYGSVWQDITGAKVYANGAWRTLSAIKAYIGGAWRDVANFTPPSGDGGGGGGGGSLSLSISPTTTTKLGTNNPNLVSNSITVTPSGGLAPYTYVWSVVTQDGMATYTINSPTLATCTVSATGCPLDQEVGCTIHCSVTDNLGVNAVSSSASVNFLNHSTF